MARPYRLLSGALLTVLCAAQTGKLNRSALPALLNFESEQTGAAPAGWGGGPPGTIFVDH